MNEEKKIYVVVDHPISFMGTKIEKGETISMTQAEAENIGLELVRPVDPEVAAAMEEKEAAETVEDSSTDESETTEESSDEQTQEQTEESTETTETAPEGTENGGDSSDEQAPTEESESDEVVE